MAALIVVGSIVFERKRRRQLAEAAERLGLSFRHERDRALPQRYPFLRALNRGSNRYAYNVVEGVVRGSEICCFDYHYQVQSGSGKKRSTTHYHYSVYSLRLPRAFPNLVIARENFLTRMAAAIGFGAISFESAEFTRTFRVNSNDRKFAYDFCHPRMMEYLLKHPDTSLELENDLLCIVEEIHMEAARLGEMVERLLEIRALLPAYLLEDVQSS